MYVKLHSTLHLVFWSKIDPFSPLENRSILTQTQHVSLILNFKFCSDRSNSLHIAQSWVNFYADFQSSNGLDSPSGTSAADNYCIPKIWLVLSEEKPTSVCCFLMLKCKYVLSLTCLVSPGRCLGKCLSTPCLGHLFKLMWLFSCFRFI